MKPRILVTNDDGVHSPGLRAAVEALYADFDVLVVAPERQQSAVGHSITLHKPLRMEPVSVGGLPVRAFQTNGTPADCVVLASLVDPPAPQLVVSGINVGANLGEEIFYSGTVSAAMEAAIQGLPAFAVSVAGTEQVFFEPAAAYVARLARLLLEVSLPSGSFLNVNVPNLPAGELREARLTRLGRRCYANQLEKRTDPRGRDYYWFSGEPCEADSTPDTDIGAVHAGFISITPIHIDITDYALLERLSAEAHRFSFGEAQVAGDAGK
ncbi:MAG: 5'/3'-nucleotidase SurE [Armatimonadetes bacterium]|nr:5'/3'-nucleotidase SurE [Armatimonadota bacterium]